MNKKLIRDELEMLGMKKYNLPPYDIPRHMAFTRQGLCIEVQFSEHTWEPTLSTTFKERSVVEGESVKHALTTLRDGLQTQLDTLDEMIAKYDEVKE